MVVAMPAMILMASLAVDLGRAQTAKSQLQAAVDAAARAAGQDLCNFTSNSTASYDAIAVAASNMVDGKSLTLQSSDVVFGTWDTAAKTFTANTATTNAVQITGYCSAARGTAIPTMLAAVVGNSTVNIHATATVYISQGLACFNANGNVTFNDTGLSNGGTWQTDSYIGNTQTYSGAVAGGAGDLCTNGTVTYNFTTPSSGQSGFNNAIVNIINGQIYSANGADCVENWTQNARGGGTYWIEYGATGDPGPSTTKMSTPASFPVPTMPTGNNNPTIPGPYLSGSYANGTQDLNLTDESFLQLPGGTYTLNSLTISNGSTLAFSGPVTLNIATNMTINAGAIEGQTDQAKYMKINLCNTGAAGANTVNITNPTRNIYADLNGPKADYNYTMGNNGNGWFGRIYSNNMTVNCNGNGAWHADQSLTMAFHLVK